MSLLEDIFLQDEADEARELECVIEGDEIEERPRSPEDSDDNSEKEDEAEEDKRRVDPTKTKATRVVKNPRFILNPARLTGPRGIQVIPEHFKDFKFKGKGYEKEDLDFVLKKLEHWAYRLYPKFQFEDCLKKIETLGKKRPVMVHLHKIRSNQYVSDEIVIQKDSSDDETSAPAQEEDEFDKLLQQQIELARVTTPGSARKGFETPSLDKRTPFTVPKATSSPSINDEQRERMIRNRRLAEERRLARLQNATSDTSKPTNNAIVEENTDDNGDIIDLDGVVALKRHNKSNVIDSSDSDEEMAVNEPITVDIHDDSGKNNKGNDKIDITDENNDVFDKDDEQEEIVSAKKHNKSNVIDSSDSDDEMTINEQITIDVHNDTGKNNKENSKINHRDETNDVFNKENDDDEIVDITENVKNDTVPIKRNKANVIDSSSSDDEITINKPTVESHNDNDNNENGIKNNININNENEMVDITECTSVSRDKINDTETINLTESNVLIKHSNFKENELIDITITDSNVLNTDKDIDSNKIIDIEEINHEIVSINANEKDIISQEKEQKNGVNTIIDDTEVEELMDLDFTDEF